MPYQTDHTHHTYPTYHTTPPPHHRGGRGTVPRPHHTTGGGGGRSHMGPVYGTHPIGGGGGGVAGPGAYIPAPWILWDYHYILQYIAIWCNLQAVNLAFLWLWWNSIFCLTHCKLHDTLIDPHSACLSDIEPGEASASSDWGRDLPQGANAWDVESWTLTNSCPNHHQKSWWI